MGTTYKLKHKTESTLRVVWGFGGIQSTSQTPLYIYRSGKCFNDFFIAAGVRLVKCMAVKRGYPLAVGVNTSM